MRARFLACLLVGCASAAPAEILYSIRGIQTSGGGYATEIQGINDSGWVAGTLQTASGALPFYSDGSGATILGDGTSGGAGAITNNGMVGGYFKSGDQVNPFIFNGNSISNLADISPAAYGSGVASLNEQGQAVLYGFFGQDVGGTTQYTLRNAYYDGTSITDVGQLLGVGPFDPVTGNFIAAGLLYDINNLGAMSGTRISGNVYNGGVGPHPIIYQNGTVTSLPATGSGAISAGYAINDQGQVTGSMLSSQGSTAFFYDGATMHSLGTLLSDPSSADPSGYFELSAGRAINEQGVIVGYSLYDGAPASGALHAFVYANGAMSDLNDLISPGSGWDLQFAFDINEFGQIVGNGMLNGEQRGFVLTPYDTEIAGQSAANPLLPTSTAGTDFVFDAYVDVLGQQVFFDPLVATGYDYSVTGSMFTSVQFTSLLDDADGYMLYSADGLTLLGIAHIGELFEFDGPLSAFKVRGIAPQNMLDPEDPMAFVAGFTFSSIGAITLTQSSYSEDYTPGVPEPASWAMMIAGLGFAGAAIRKRAASVRRRVACA